jgi:hypothetical protein
MLELPGFQLRMSIFHCHPNAQLSLVNCFGGKPDLHFWEHAGDRARFRTSVGETIMVKAAHFHICIAMQE